MHTGPWTIAEAKSKFSELIDRTSEGPQTINRNGRPAAVVVSPQEWERKARRSGNLAEFLAASSLPDFKLKPTRSKGPLREPGL